MAGQRDRRPIAAEQRRRGGAAHHLLVLRRERSLPGQQRAADAEQWQRELREHRQGGAGPRDDDVGSPHAARHPADVFGALGEDGDVRGPSVAAASRRNAALPVSPRPASSAASAARARGGAPGCPPPEPRSTTLAGASASRSGRAAIASRRWSRATDSRLHDAGEVPVRVRVEEQSRRRLADRSGHAGGSVAASVGAAGEERFERPSAARPRIGGVGHENAPGWSRFSLPDALTVSSTGSRIGPVAGSGYRTWRPSRSRTATVRQGRRWRTRAPVHNRARTASNCG